MVKGTHTHHKPGRQINVNQLIRLMIGQPTSLEVAFGAIRGKRITKQCDLAKILGVSVNKIYATINKLKALPPGTTEFPKPKGRGRPTKNTNLSLEAKNYALDRETLRR